MFGKFPFTYFFSSPRPVTSGENEENLTLLAETKPKDHYIIPVEAEQTTIPSSESLLKTFQRYFSEPIIWTILEYNLDDLAVIKESPELLAKMFHKEPELASIILLLTEIDRINALSLNLKPEAQKRFALGSRVLKLFFSLLFVPEIVFLIWYTREQHNKFFPISALVHQAENLIFPSCSIFPHNKYVYPAPCHFTEGMLIYDFNCTAALVKSSKYDQLCSDYSHAAGVVVGYALGTALIIACLIILLACLYSHNVSFYSDKTSDLSSQKYIPLQQRQKIAALLNNKNNNLTGFTIYKLLQKLQTTLKSTIKKWQSANPESGFDMVLSCLEDSSSKNLDARNAVLNAMIYGRHGYLTRNRQLMFSGELAENSVVMNETNTHSNMRVGPP